MKKKLVWISMLLVCVTMLTSCAGLLQVMPAPANANQVIRRMNTRVQSLDGYRIDVTGSFTAYADTTKIIGTLEGFAIEDQGKDKDDYYYHMEMINKSQTGNGSQNVTVKSTEAYYDGYAYSFYSEGATWRKLCSPMTKNEFLDYIADDSLLEIKTDGCKNKELQKADDGYTVKYSGYSEAAISDFFDMMSFTKDMFGKMPSDLAVTIKTDKDYYPQSFTLELVFEESKTSYYKPEFSMTMSYSQFDAVERQTKSLSPDKYKQIESLSLLKEVDQLIEDRIEAKEGSFTTTTDATASILSQSNKETQTYKVTFAREKDGLTFEADLTDKNGKEHISYANGEKTTEYSGKTNTTKMTEDEAEQFIAQLINDPAMGYNPNYVSDIKKVDDGYEITMEVSKDTVIGQIITSAGAKFSSGSHTVKITVENGKITTMRHTYRASGSLQIGFGQNATLNYSGSTFVSFD